MQLGPEFLMSSGVLLAPALRRFCAEEALRFRVSGHCMSPAIPAGSTIELVPRRLHLPGDIVAFEEARGFVAHRVIGYRPRLFRIELVTQGDHAASPDVPVASSRILGGVKAHVALRERLAAIVRFLRFALSRLGAS